MTGKERVLSALAFCKTDRVPVSFSANAGTTERLIREWGLRTPEELLKKVGSDIVEIRGLVEPLYRGPVPKMKTGPDGIKENFWGMRTRVIQTATGPEECYCNFALADASGIDDFVRYSWPKADWFDFSDIADRLAPWKDSAVLVSGTSVYQHATYLRGMDNLLADMAGDPPLANYLLDRFTDFYEDYFDRLLTSAHGRIDILRIVDDLAMQDRLLFSPETFDEFIAPRIRRMVSVAKSHSVHVMFHSCGAVAPLIPRLIELGVEILDPVQVSAKGMEPEVLKAGFGKNICFHGGIDTQRLLPHASPSEVRENVHHLIDVLGKNGGYILAPSHTLQTDVPTENIQALYETATGSVWQ